MYIFKSSLPCKIRAEVAYPEVIINILLSKTYLTYLYFTMENVSYLSINYYVELIDLSTYLNKKLINFLYKVFSAK